MSEVSSHLRKLSPGEQPDYLTFVSNGEPTLDINLGRSIRLLKKLGFPVAVISNASLLSDASVREDLDAADWVSVKVDAADPETWKNINRPADKLKFDNHIDGVLRFADGYKGLLRTESMICREVNDTESNIAGLASIMGRIKPGKAYISIPIRPPAEKNILPPDADRLNLTWQKFTGEGVDTELLAGFEGTDTGFTGNIYEDILNITAVHPLREDALMELLAKNGADPGVVDSLVSQKLIMVSFYNGRKFYLRDFHLK